MVDFTWLSYNVARHNNVLVQPSSAAERVFSLFENSFLKGKTQH